MFCKLLIRSPNIAVFSTIWLSIIGYIAYYIQIKYIFMIIPGYFIQTLGEYLIHRFIFHGILWNMHGIHHKYPEKERHLITPLPFSLIMAYITYILYTNFIPFYLSNPLLLGNFMGYINFEYIHYLSHTRSRNIIIKYIKNIRYIRYLLIKHKIHHFKKDDMFYNFGFSSLIWDYIFSSYH